MTAQREAARAEEIAPVPSARDGRRSVIAAVAFVAAWLIVHGAIGAWVPLAGDDWRHVRWDATHASGWWAAHASLGEVCAAMLARFPMLHALASPVLGFALVVGTFALAMRRLPDPRRRLDVLGVALASAMLWIALPRAGAMWFHRSYAATQIWGGAIAVWLAVPYRLCWRGGGAAPAACAFVVGGLAATTMRAFAVALVLGLAISTLRARRDARRAWQWAGVAGAVVGMASSIARAPWSEAARVVSRLEPTLAACAPLLRSGALLLVALGLAMLLRRGAAAEAASAEPKSTDAVGAACPDPVAMPDAGDSLRALLAWLALGAAAQLGPRGSEATWLPAALALVVAALPWARWLARTRIGFIAAAVVVIAFHVGVWQRALVRYAELRDEASARLARLAKAPAGSVAQIAPYRRVVADAWWIGEDWLDAAPREAVAREVWGLAELELVPRPRQLERSAGLGLALEVEGIAPALLDAAQPPARWSRELGAARRQFDALVARLHRIAGPEVVARLRVTDVAVPGTNADPRSRPVYAAWVEGPRRSPPPTTHGALDVASQVRIAGPPVALPEAWLVTGAQAQRLACDGGSCRARLLQSVRTVILFCDALRCSAADAWVPRF